MTTEAMRAVVQLRRGDHICLLYENATEYLKVIALYLKGGLEQGERCVHVADDYLIAETAAALTAAGVDVCWEQERGALSLLTKNEAHLRSGMFDPEDTIAFLRETEEESDRASFSGLRLTGDMAWALGPEPGNERVLEYEELLNHFYPSSHCLGLCSYNLRQFPLEMVTEMLRIHPVVLLGNQAAPNLYFEPSLLSQPADQGEWMVAALKRILRTEQELLEALALQEQTLSLLPAAAYVCDRERRITFFNQAAAAAWGREPKLNDDQDRFCGSYKIYLPDGTPVPRAESPVAQTLRDGASRQGVEALIKRPDGSRITIIANVIPLKDEAGRVTGALASFLDITQQKLLQAQLLHAQKVDSLGRLAAGMAHEFNNLLGAIMGFNSLALQKAPPATEVTGYLQEVDKAVKRASGLVRQLLAFSRVQDFAPKVLDCNNLILESDLMLRRLVGADVELVLALAPDLGLVRADPGQLTQVLVNLVVNARDAMPEGGQLIISTSNLSLEPEQALRLGVAGAGEYIVLTVADTGLGMTKEVKAHLFEPFFTTKEVGKGTGLGLSTCYGIVRQAGGQIEVLSEPGQGATFKIYLPVATEGVEVRTDTVEPEDRRQTNAQPPAEETVLLAEDDPLIRKLVCDVLQAWGYTVLEASNGGDALALASNHAGREVHLLVADLIMPGMSGKELAERFRETHPESKVLFISGHAKSFIPDDSLMNAGDGILTKPFMPDELVARIQELLNGARA
jgi:signal transduction histidine kinase/ActR/RegA family two-component response regulator